MSDNTKTIKGRTGDWEIVMGLEIHAQVASNAKLFSGAAVGFGAGPNEQVSLVDAGFPGMLPTLNKHCVEQAVKSGLGLKAQILADAGDLEGAEVALAAAETVATDANDAPGVTGTMVRRAYLMARSGSSAEDVKAQLLAAGDQAREAGHEALGRYTADTMAAEIEERCGGEYKGLLDAPEDMEFEAPVDGGMFEE